MNDRVLSICMPTYKRRKKLQKAYSTIVKQIKECCAEEIVEYIISVNPAGDGTEKWLSEQDKEKFVSVNINRENIGADNNIALVLTKATGKYVWLVGDDDILLDGSVQKVLRLIQQYPNLAWIYMNYGYEDRQAKNIEPMYLIKKIEGYYENGRQAMLSNFKYLDGGILFTTANIYLREGMDELIAKGVQGPQCTMIYTMYAATKGVAYIISEPMIDQGQDILWKDEAYDIVILNFNNVLLKLVNNGYEEKEIIGLIRTRMHREAVSIWFLLLKEFIKDFDKAVKHYMWYLKLIPWTTLGMTVTLPFWAIYLIIRHKYRTFKRSKQKRALRIAQ